MQFLLLYTRNKDLKNTNRRKEKVVSDFCFLMEIWLSSDHIFRELPNTEQIFYNEIKTLITTLWQFLSWT